MVTMGVLGYQIYGHRDIDGDILVSIIIMRLLGLLWRLWRYNFFPFLLEGKSLATMIVVLQNFSLK